MLVLLTSIQLNAEQSVYYGSIGLHSAEYDLGNEITAAERGLFDLDIGFSITDTLNFELGYKDFGEIVITGNGSANIKVDSVSAAGLGMFSVNEKLYVYAEIGIEYWAGDLSYENVPGFDTGNVSDEGLDFYYGIGGELKLESGLSVYVEYHRHDPGSLEINTLGAGLKSYFF